MSSTTSASAFLMDFSKCAPSDLSQIRTESLKTGFDQEIIFTKRFYLKVVIPCVTSESIFKSKIYW